MGTATNVSTGGSLDLGKSINLTDTAFWTLRHVTLAGTQYSASGIIPPVAGTAFITKATAAAMTLAAPALADDGAVLIITSETAAAHTVTATTLLADAVSGSPHTTATFAAFIGTSLVLMAANKLWNVVASTGVTIT